MTRAQKALQAREREERVLHLRKAGASLPAIAKEVGYSTSSGAHQALARALKRALAPDAASLRETEGERLDALQLGLWGKAMTGDSRAAEVIVKVMERRAKLFGLDAPLHKVIEVISEDAIDKAIRELTLELGMNVDPTNPASVQEAIRAIQG